MALSLAIPGAADAEWDFTYGDGGPTDFSQFNEVVTTADGGAVIFGVFSGQFEGIDVGLTFASFVQYRDAAGAVVWTAPLPGEVGCDDPEESDSAIDVTGVAYFLCRNDLNPDDPVPNSFDLVSADVDGVIAVKRFVGAAEVRSDVGSPSGLLAAPGGGVRLVAPTRVFRSPGGGDPIRADDMTLAEFDAELGEAWSVDMPEEFADPFLRGPLLSVASGQQGATWVGGYLPKPISFVDEAIGLVRVDEGGASQTTIRHFGYGCGAKLLVSNGTVVDVIRSAPDELWVYTCEDVSSSPDLLVERRLILSLDPADGRILGEVAFPDARQDPELNAALESYLLEFDQTGSVASVQGGDVLWRVVGALGETTWERIDLGLEEMGSIPASTESIGDGDVVVVGGAGDVELSQKSTLIGMEPLSTRRSAFITRRQLPALSSLAPARLLDSRKGEVTVDGVAQAIGRRPAGSVTPLRVRDRAGVPDAAESVIINVTAVRPDRNGYITVYPCGAEPPLTSSLNYRAGQAKGNNVVSRIGTNDSVCLFTSAAVDLVVDVGGYLWPDAGFGSVVPGRLLDTRAAGETVDGRQEAVGRLASGDVLRVAIEDRAGVDPEAATVVLNVTAIRPERRGYLTVWPCDSDQPTASSLNFGAGETVGNNVISKISGTGEVCIFTSAATDLSVDVSGHFASDSGFQSIVPARIYETRRGETTVDGAAATEAPMNPAVNQVIHIGDRAGVGGNPNLAVLNMTAVNPQQSGFVTVWACVGDFEEPPLTSALNFSAGQTAGNNVITRVSNGRVCVRSSATTDLVVDVAGYM
ncbi:MAG: hypothetical protein ACE37B_18610 [Ilumatobacter sp.]|jgi:hypothetical protein|uniref:hypothetical protein n=1 Tax=Ilumatobacter sp. TaxID=1967498 RepID=UPI00391CA998